MSNENINNNGAVDPANALATLWAQCFEQANDQARVMLEALRQSGDPGEMQKRWLDAVGQSLDGFMRTEAFLESMRRNLKVMTDLKSMQDQMVQDTGRALGIPLATDIAGLYERLHSHEHAVLDRLNEIEERLGGIESALDDLAGSARQPVAEPRRPKALDDRLAALEAGLAALGADEPPAPATRAETRARAAPAKTPAKPTRRLPKRGPK